MTAPFSPITSFSATCSGARAEYLGRGTANAEKWRRIAALILEAESEYRASTNAHLGIVTSVTGLNGQDVVSDPVVAEARKLAEGLAEVQPPAP